MKAEDCEVENVDESEEHKSGRILTPFNTFLQPS